MNDPALPTQPESFGRYLLYPAIARGGMATVHTARLLGAEGFTRLVAAKRLHPQFSDDPDFVTMFHDEACIASLIHHPNVVPVLDVVMSGGELILVQEYVHGVPLSQLMKAHVDGTPISVDVAITVLAGILAGLHAAHEVRDENGETLEIVHRDVSPQNVMISVDGIPRLLDFGIAKARTSNHHTREGVFKGKLAYMAPEQLRMEAIDRTIDVYATGVLAWEMLVNRRIYDGRHELAFVTAVMNGEIPTLVEALADRRTAMGEERWKEIVALDAIVRRAMSSQSSERFATASDMMMALLDVRAPASAMAVAEWVREAGANFLDERKRTLAANEESWRRTSVYPPTPASGTRRTRPTASGSVLVLDTPSGTDLSAASVRTSVPPPVTWPSAHPNTYSGSYQAAGGPAPFAHARARLGGSRVLPWVAGASFVIAGVLGGLLRGATDISSAVVTSAAAGAGVNAVGAPIAATTSLLALGAQPATTTSPSGAPAQDTLAATPPAATPAATPRVFHPAPPPPPPRVVIITRPAPPPPPVPVATAKNDCNPPFYFDGTKKIFKTSCL